MSDKKRKEELKEKYKAILLGEQKRLKSDDTNDEIGIYELYNIIIIKINL
jgi:hypothetical protein